MTTAAFKSNSRRGNVVGGLGGEDSPKKNPLPKQGLRRSSSVNALSRPTTTAKPIDISSEFLNKRDNPLYWVTGGSPPVENTTEIPVTLLLVSGAGAVEPRASKSSNAVVNQRGRSFTRNLDLGSNDKEEIGGRRRSLSRVKDFSDGIGRRGRSVSRVKSAFGALETDAEQESIISATYRGRSNSVRVSSSTAKLPGSGAKASEMWDRNRSSHLSRHPSVGSALNSWEDGISTSSLSEAEEKTIKAVYEQMESFQGENSREETASNEIYETVRSEVRRAIADMQNDLENAIKRNNTSAIESTDVSDIPPDLVNPGAVELALDIRNEYAKKLEEFDLNIDDYDIMDFEDPHGRVPYLAISGYFSLSPVKHAVFNCFYHWMDKSQERARKLRSDLAIEEHCGQELSRILKETLPDPNKSTAHRSRLGRKNSSERKKMSKHLTDEAMSYFDECVSISTFDSSDFSAAEDSVGNPADASLTAGASISLPQNNGCISATSGSHSCLNPKEQSSIQVNTGCSELTMDRISESSDNAESDRKFRFSFGQKPNESIKLQQDIRNYINFFEKDGDKDGTTSERIRTNYYDIDGYRLLDGRESLLFDQVIYRNRIQSGSLHICGGVLIPFLPFAYLI